MPPGHLQNHKVPERLQASGKGLSTAMVRDTGVTEGKHETICCPPLLGLADPMFLWGVCCLSLLSGLKAKKAL